MIFRVVLLLLLAGPLAADPIDGENLLLLPSIGAGFAVRVSNACPAPHFDGGTAAFQFVGGVGAGAVTMTLGLTSAVLLSLILGHEPGRPLIAVAALSAYFVGSAAGVYAVGNLRGQTASFPATLAGSVLGFGAPGAVVGFQLTREHLNPTAACP
jgi:hypothetical protein